jgi:hypothetical protein
LNARFALKNAGSVPDIGIYRKERESGAFVPICLNAKEKVAPIKGIGNGADKLYG